MDSTSKQATDPDSDMTDEQKQQEQTQPRVAPGTPDPRIRRPQDNRIKKPR